MSTLKSKVPALDKVKVKENKKAKAKKVNTSRESVQAKHTFSNDERLDLNRCMTDEMTRVDELQDQLGSIQSDYKSRIKTAEAQVKSFHNKLVSGYEMRQVEAIVRYFPKKREKHMFYADRPKVLIRVEPMSPADFHMEMQLNDPKKTPVPAVEAKAEMPKAPDGSLATPLGEVKAE